MNTLYLIANALSFRFTLYFRLLNPVVLSSVTSDPRRKSNGLDGKCHRFFPNETKIIIPYVILAIANNVMLIIL